MSAHPTHPRAGRRNIWKLALAALAVALPCRATVTSNTFDPIQALVGAERFYENGFYGFGTVIANVEAGHAWNGHEVFTEPVGPGLYYVQDPTLDALFPVRQYDGHATATASILAGIGPFQPGLGYYYYQFGMAPGAALISSAIATHWIGNSGEFETSDESFNSGYLIPMRDGVPIEIFGQGTGITIQLRADVVNSSWGGEDSAGNGHEAMMVDALIDLYRQTVCMSAGNHDGPNEVVVSPASGFNGIAVAALTSDLTSPKYTQLAPFSNVGPNDFHNPKTNATIPAIRAAVDIAAPGTDIIAPAYTGPTGSNTGQSDPFPGQNDIYYVGIAGTSFSSPIVAGGAALMINAGRVRIASPLATDSLVIKVVLLNSATKTPGWSNGQHLENGVIRTTQGLDYAVGAGALNLNRAYDQYLAGDTDLPGLTGGSVKTLGWDYGKVINGTPNDYNFAMSLTAGEQLTATLDWMIHRNFDNNTRETSELYFNDLDLQLWDTFGGLPFKLVAESATLYNNVEHLFITVPQDGYYMLRVRFFGNTFDVPGNSPLAEEYALAWSVPEPGCLSVIWIGAMLLTRRGRRQVPLISVLLDQADQPRRRSLRG